MKVICDIEANSLTKPTNIWVIVCKDVDTGKVSIFREVTCDQKAKEDFLSFMSGVTLLVGHNILGYDLPVLQNLLSFTYPLDGVIDTLVVSKLTNYSKEGGHSIETYGKEFGLPKIEFSDWTKWSQEMEDYCVRDVDINLHVYNKYLRIISDPAWKPSIDLEQRFQRVVNSLHNNGFSFNSNRARTLLMQVEKELEKLDKEILDAFPDRPRLVREITPTLTKHGTLHRKDFRWIKNGDLSEYNGGPFCLFVWQQFNPSSHRQIVDVLHNAEWQPTDKTKTHVETLRELSRLKREKQRDKDVDLAIEVCHNTLLKMEKTGWKVNENNLSTLPPEAPSPARTLARRILYESRRRTLTEWLGLVSDEGRIHGTFQAIGAWTHRMAHQRPNMANIPNESRTDGSRQLLGKEMRSLWQAPRKRLLVGVDAEGIQLRIFAHYIDDKEFTEALVKGKKEDKSDPHSLNQRILGNVCKSRQAAKRFIYALLLGAGTGKLTEILACTKQEAMDALARLMARYQGFEYLKKSVIPKDAKRGWFRGLDGRHVPIPGETESDRRHLCMSGYLQCGEAICMKKATLKFHDLLKNDNAILVNLVHDEWQTETPNNMEIAVRVAKLQAESLHKVGEELQLKCPLAGSYFNEDKRDYTVGTNWSVTH